MVCRGVMIAIIFADIAYMSHKNQEVERMKIFHWSLLYHNCPLVRYLGIVVTKLLQLLLVKKKLRQTVISFAKPPSRDASQIPLMSAPDTDQPSPIEAIVPFGSKISNVQFTTQTTIEGNPKSSLARSRKLTLNIGPRRIFQNKCATSKQITSALEKYPGVFKVKSFTTSTGKTVKGIFCMCCKKTLTSAKASHVKDHIVTLVHQAASEASAKEKQANEREATLMSEFLQANRMSGETTDQATLAFRMQCLRMVIRAGIPLHALDLMRTYLETFSGLRLTHSSNLRRWINFILTEEINMIKEELKLASEVFVVFDGTTKVDEVFAIVFRWVDEDFNIIQRLVHIGKYVFAFKYVDRLIGYC